MYAWGSTPLTLQVSMSDAMIAQFSPPPSEPAKSAFSRPHDARRAPEVAKPSPDLAGLYFLHSFHEPLGERIGDGATRPRSAYSDVWRARCSRKDHERRGRDRVRKPQRVRPFNSNAFQNCGHYSAIKSEADARPRSDREKLAKNRRLAE
jgi:hypothetical protein